MKPYFLCALLPLILAAPADPETSKWEDFKSLHGKKHAAHEELQRKQTFMKNDAACQAHNKRFAAGQAKYSCSVNQYSDMSEEEFEAAAFGLIPVDEETEPLESTTGYTATALPENFDWRDKGVMTPVKNQGYCGSCYVFAVSAAVEAYLKWKENLTLDLSEQDAIDCTYKRYGRLNSGCGGGWPTHVFQYYNQKDIIEESDYPYQSGRTRRRNECRFNNSVNQLIGRSLVFKRVIPKDEDMFAKILVAKGPVVVAISTRGSFGSHFRQMATGLFDDDKTSANSPNHAVLLTGYGTDNGTDYWVIKNSWGPGWGDKGYAKIKRGRNMCNIMDLGVWYIETALGFPPTPIGVVAS